MVQAPPPRRRPTLSGFDTPVYPRWIKSLYLVLQPAVILIVGFLYLAFLPGTRISLFGRPFLVGTTTPGLGWSTHSVGSLYGREVPIGPALPSYIHAKLTYVGNATLGSPQGNVTSTIETGFVRHMLAVSLLTLVTVGVITCFMSILYHGGLKAGVRTGAKSSLVTLLVPTLAIGSYGWMAGRSFHGATSISDLFGSPDNVTLPQPATTVDRATDAVTIGDSILSGKGLPLAAKPSTADQQCGRSPEAAAGDLQMTMRTAVPTFTVTNLACSSATIDNGLVYPQAIRDAQLPLAQLSAVEAMPNLKFIFISVGADDVRWSSVVSQCFAIANCGPLTQPQFESDLNDFVTEWFGLMESVKTITSKLKHQVAVVVNEYYSPFGSVINCPDLTVTKDGQKLQLTAANVQTLSVYRNQLNDIIDNGAKSSGFFVARPSFEGNELCSADSYVQGTSTPHGTFHPTEAGEWLIGSTDLAAIPNWPAIAAGLATPAPQKAAADPVSPGATPSVSPSGP